MRRLSAAVLCIVVAWRLFPGFLNFPSGSRSLRSQAQAFPARFADGHERLQDLSVLVEEVESSEGPLKVEAMLPELGDLEPLSYLLLESFIEVVEPWMLPESLGGIASGWNWLVEEFERQVIKATLTVNYKKLMTQPSLRKPRGYQLEGEFVGILLVTDAGRGREIVAFLELGMLPPDGRTPDDALGSLLTIFGGNTNARPYLQNFCVAPAWRRRGLGRSMLRLAETVVRDIWREDRIYLHAGKSEASRNLYRSSGYQMTGLLNNRDSLHMSKILEEVTESADVLEPAT